MLSLRELLVVFGLGAIGYYLASTLDFLGLQYVTAGVGRLLLFAYPTIVVLLSAAFFKKPIRAARQWQRWSSPMRAWRWFLSEAAGGENRDLPMGAALVFGSALALCGLSRHRSRGGAAHRRHPLRGTRHQRGLPVLHPAIPVVAAAVGAGAAEGGLRPDGHRRRRLHGDSIFLTAEALRRIGANQVAMIGAVGPVSAIVFGGIVLDETMSPIQLGGRRAGHRRRAAGDSRSAGSEDGVGVCANALVLAIRYGISSRSGRTAPEPEAWWAWSS